ncbi:hypothetical protein, partial [Acidithiobacillus sp.]|uniref:hypothetical protein n=1 Tax=Acidithiobacillus sp. TaxID=1872118 RepID=UPI003D0510B3
VGFTLEQFGPSVGAFSLEIKIIRGAANLRDARMILFVWEGRFVIFDIMIQDETFLSLNRWLSSFYTGSAA